jgi:hypothetical protein
VKMKTGWLSNHHLHPTMGGLVRRI